MTSARCSTCQKATTPLVDNSGFVLCESCGLPDFFGDLSSPFDVLGVPKTFALDEKLLETRYYELSRHLHPDRFAGAGTKARMKSQEMAAALNKAYISLRQADNRLDTLLKSVDALTTQTEKLRSTENASHIPTELAERYFEAQEAALDADENASRLIAELRATLEAKARQLAEEIHDLALKTNWAAREQPVTPKNVDEILGLRHERSYISSMLENLDKLGARDD